MVRLILLGVTIGLAVLSKMAGLLLLPLAALVLLLLTWGATRGDEEANASWWWNWLLALALVTVLRPLAAGEGQGAPWCDGTVAAARSGTHGITLSPLHAPPRSPAAPARRRRGRATPRCSGS